MWLKVLEAFKIPIGGGTIFHADFFYLSIVKCKKNYLAPPLFSGTGSAPVKVG